MEELRGSEESEELDELALYSLERQSETHPLVWWRENRPKFPVLADMARKYLAIWCYFGAVGTECLAREQITVTQKRNRLKTSNVAAIMFLHENLELLGEDGDEEREKEKEERLKRRRERKDAKKEEKERRKREKEERRRKEEEDEEDEENEQQENRGDDEEAEEQHSDA